MNYLSFCSLCAVLLTPALGGNLLAVHFVATGSYVRLMDGILQTLAPHNKITLYSLAHDEAPHPNVTLVKVKAPTPKNFFFKGMFDYLCNEGPFWISHKALLSTSAEYVEEIFADENFKNLMATKPKFDALLTFATFSEFTIPLAHVLQTPLIEISAPVPMVAVNDAVGDPAWLSTTLNFYDQTPGYTFMERVSNYLGNLEVYLRFYYSYIPLMESVLRRHLPASTPSWASLHRNTSLLIINGNTALGYARPHMPNVVNIGGIHCRPPTKLDQDLQDFMDGSGEHGVIYFSFGSSIRSRFPDHVTRAIVRVFARLPQRVLWKWNEELEGLPKNVRMAKWFSQQDVLGHNKTRLFITQSGLFSMQETAYHGVPILAIPIAFDQQANAVTAKHMGYCEYISFCDFSEDQFYELIQKLILDPKYRRNVKRISKLMKDVPMTASEQLVWWVDFVVRHNGYPTVQLMRDQSYGLRRLDLDVVSFLYACALLAVLVLVYLMYKAKQYFELFRNSISIKKKSD